MQRSSGLNDGCVVATWAPPMPLVTRVCSGLKHATGCGIGVLWPLTFHATTLCCLVTLREGRLVKPGIPSGMELKICARLGNA